MSSGTINLILSCGFVFILLVGFLLGFWRGVRRSAVSFGIGVVGVIVAFFVTPPITNAILQIQVPAQQGQVALSQYILDMLLQDEQLAGLIEANPNLETLVAALPAAIANVVFFILVTMVIMLLMYVIYKIIALTCLKPQEDQKLYRTWGGAVGVVKAFVITIFVLMPLSALIGLYGQITSQADIYVKQETDTQSERMLAEGKEEEQNRSSLKPISEYIPAQVDEIVGQLGNNFLFKMCGATAADEAMFDYMSKIEVDGQNLFFRQELVSYAEVYNAAAEISNIGQSEHNFSELNFEVLQTIFDRVIDGTLFEKIAAELIASVVENYQNYENIFGQEFVQQYSQLFEDVASGLESAQSAAQYFKNDLQQVFNVFKTLCQNGVVDEIRAQSKIGAEQIIKILGDDADSLSSTLSGIFNMNLVRDSFDFLFNTFVSPSLSDMVEDDSMNVSSDSSTMQDDDWQALANDLTAIFEDFAAISKEIDIKEFVEDPFMLIESPKEPSQTEEEVIDIEKVLSKVGSMVDRARGIELLKNSAGEPIVDVLLGQFNVTLPTNEEIYDSDGKLVEIENYQSYMSFLSGSLIEVRDSGLYEILTEQKAEEIDVASIIKQLAAKVENQENGQIDREKLGKILLPLLQVEPTKSLLQDNVLASVDNEYISFKNIEGYQEWKAELGYFTDIIVALSNQSSTEKTYVDLLFEEDGINKILTSINSQHLTELLKPAFWASSTDGLKKTLIETMNSLFKQIAPDMPNLTWDDNTFVAESSEDQTEEICLIFSDLLGFYNDYLELGEDFSFASIDKVQLGVLLNHIKANAYRVQLSEGTQTQKQKEGLFNGVFNALWEALCAKFDVAQRIVGQKKPWQIDFESLMNAAVELQSALEETSGFLKDIASELKNATAGGLSVEDVTEAVEKITQDLPQETTEIIEQVLGSLDEFEVEIDVALGQTAEQIQDNKDEIIDAINSIPLSDQAKDSLKGLFGVLS